MPLSHNDQALSSLSIGYDRTPEDQIATDWVASLKEGMTVLHIGDPSKELEDKVIRKIGLTGQMLTLDPRKLNEMNLQKKSADAVISFFNFEFSAQARKSFEHLAQTLKPGGLAVFGELDQSHLNHYPLAPHLQDQLLEIAAKMKELELWDPFIGRKVFSFFKEADFEDIRVDLKAFELVLGASDPADRERWTQRLRYFEKLVTKNILDLDFSFSSFKSEFLGFFENPERMSYSTLITVRGRKNRWS